LKRGVYNSIGRYKNIFKGGEGEMKRAASAILPLVMIVLLVVALAGCGADIKAQNEKLKAENASLKSDTDKLKLEVQKLKEEMQKAAEKDATIGSLKVENEALKQQVGDLKAQLAKKKKK
jgi:cell division protein FtsB